MKVLHINSNYLTSKLHENLIDNLSKEGINSTIFMPLKHEKTTEFLYESKHEVYYPITFKNADKYFFLNKQKKIFNKLISTVKINEFNLIHAHTLFTDGYVALKLFEKYNIPYIITVRGGTDLDIFFKYRLNLRKKGREILKNAKKIIFLSENTRYHLLNQYITSMELKKEITNKSVILPNGIDHFWFENEGTCKSLNSIEQLKFIQVGKIYQRKNILGTIKAIKQFDKSNQCNSVLTIIGTIEDQNYANKIKKETELEVHLIDSKPREQLIDYYRNHDIFIMPSFNETFGLVYPEAMSQGLPVIYTKGQGFDKQFPDGEVGYSVDANSPIDIAKKIELINQNYKLMSKNSIKKYKKFNWQKISAEYIKIYNEILSHQ